MIFITLGSQKFQFNRLLMKADELIEARTINDLVFAQLGVSNYVPKYFQYKDFLNKSEFDTYMTKADIVITHGGTGTIMGAIKRGKKVIAVPRFAQYGEHVDNHQKQIIEQLESSNLIEACYDVDQLGNAIANAKSRFYNTYHSNTDRIIESIDYFINYI